MSQKSMLVYRSDWTSTPTFKLIPISSDCPFNECVFDPTQMLLSVVSKDQITKLQIVPKLDGNGRLKPIKGPKTEDEPGYVQERMALPAYYIYYLDNKEDIKDFIERFAVNPDHEAVELYMNAPKASAVINEIPEAGATIDLTAEVTAAE